MILGKTSIKIILGAVGIFSLIYLPTRPGGMDMLGSSFSSALFCIFLAVIISPLIWCLYISIPKLLAFLRTPDIDPLNKQGAIVVTVGFVLYGASCTIGLPLLLLGWAGEPAWWANPLYFLAIEVPGVKSFIKSAKLRSSLLGLSALISLSFLIRGLQGGTVVGNVMVGGDVPILPTLSIPHGDYCIYWVWLTGISLSFLGSLTYRPIDNPPSK